MRQCKYCNKPAGRNILPSGRNKGYYRTCGANECLTSQYRDPTVSERKRFAGTAICDLCSNPFQAVSARQKWCKVCVPDKNSRRIAQRYGLSKAQHTAMAGMCPICQKRPACFVDHDHISGKVRGLICSHCNTSLNLVEDKEALNRALIYLENGGDLSHSKVQVK